jgi:hypothetical protein
VINKWGGYFKYPENNRKRAVDFVWKRAFVSLWKLLYVEYNIEAPIFKIKKRHDWFIYLIKFKSLLAEGPLIFRDLIGLILTYTHVVGNRWRSKPS